MKRLPFLSIVLAFLAFDTTAQFADHDSFYEEDEYFYRIGPYISMNFGKSTYNVTYGLTYEKWKQDVLFGGLPLGYQMGIEFSSGVIKAYAEIMPSLWALGIGLGPVLEMNPKTFEMDMGIQTTVWVDYMFGVFCRHHLMANNENIFSTGIYWKQLFLENPWRLEEGVAFD